MMRLSSPSFEHQGLIPEAKLEKAMEGHVLATAELVGVYKR